MTRASRVRRDAAGRRFAARRTGALVSFLFLSATVVLVAGPSLFPVFVLAVLVGAVFFLEAGALLACACAGLVLVLLTHGSVEALSNAAGVEALVALGSFTLAGLALARVQRRHRRRQDALAVSSLTDRLTGLYTYGTFVDYLRNEVRKTERYGGDLCLLMVDLDHFKRFNDRHGHQAGNELLRRIGATLRGHVREADMAARYGGEEFALLIRGDERDGHDLAERLRRAVEATGVSLSDGRVVFGTASVGLADRALYESKRRGRNRVTPASELAARAGQAPPRRRATLTA